MEFRIEQFEKVESTNIGIKCALEAGEPEGLVWRSRVQTGGYGRQGRTWSSPEGGLYQSVLLRPQVPLENLPTLSLVVALCVCDATRCFFGLDEEEVQVKWPNDVVSARGKLAGLSLEAHAGGVCLGMGVNVFRPASEQPVGGKNTPAYVEDMLLSGTLPERGSAEATALIGKFGDELLYALGNRYDLWQREGFAPFANVYRGCNDLRGRLVKLVTLDGSVIVEGEVEDVDDAGRLLVATAQGIVPVSSGEAHIM